MCVRERESSAFTSLYNPKVLTSGLHQPSSLLMFFPFRTEWLRRRLLSQARHQFIQLSAPSHSNISKLRVWPCGLSCLSWVMKKCNCYFSGSLYSQDKLSHQSWLVTCSCGPRPKIPKYINTTMEKGTQTHTAQNHGSISAARNPNAESDWGWYINYSITFIFKENGPKLLLILSKKTSIEKHLLLLLLLLEFLL